jgi:hypothetical protein
MALSTDHEDIDQLISRLTGKEPRPETIEELGRRVDALVEAVEILARERYEFPTIPESNLRNALLRAGLR